jgi:hypothetical protein
MSTPVAPHIAASAMVHVAVVLSAVAAPRPPRTQAAQVDEMRPYLVALETRSRHESKVIADGPGAGEGRAVDDTDGDGVAAGGEKHEQAAGKAGSTLSRESERRRWSAPRKPPVLDDRWDGKSRSAADFGMIGLLGHRGSVPIRSDGSRTPALPSDPALAEGSMWARPLGESPGIGAAGLSGTGLGGGGVGAGIGLDHIGELGHGDGQVGPGTGGRGAPIVEASGVGIWWGDDAGWGRDGVSGRAEAGPGHGVGSLQGSRRTWGPTVWTSGTAHNSRIPPETIQRIVRENFGRFRLCYERGLLRNATLAGRVATRFVIGSSGAVVTASNEASDLPDAEVVSCVTQAFAALMFPEEPGDSQVIVVYPIMFTPE